MDEQRKYEELQKPLREIMDNNIKKNFLKPISLKDIDQLDQIENSKGQSNSYFENQCNEIKHNLRQAIVGRFHRQNTKVYSNSNRDMNSSFSRTLKRGIYNVLNSIKAKFSKTQETDFDPNTPQLIDMDVSQQNGEEQQGEKLLSNFSKEETSEKKVIQPYVIQPEGNFKTKWDILITLMLLYTCIQSPYSIAFFETNDYKWIIPNAILDFIFFIDIFINFSTAFYDKEFEKIEDRSKIARNYVTSWFTIDFLSIIPFDYIYSTGSYNRLARVIRIGKIYKIVKMTRLIRMLKIVKQKSQFVKYLNQFLQIGAGFERLLFLLVIFLVMCHITACIWIFIGKFDEGSKINWIFVNNFQDYDNYTLYITSFYFTVTTIVTVGYGDIHAYSIGEKYMSIFLMIIGVIAFSYVTGALSNIISNYDASQAKFKEKISTLNRLRGKYEIQQDLYDEINKSINHFHSKSYHDIVFFLEDGEAGFVIQRFFNIVYIKVQQGNHFGHLDLVFDTEVMNIHTQIKFKKKTQRSKEIYDLDKMKLEFPEVFDDLFSDCVQRFGSFLKLKIDAIKQMENENFVNQKPTMLKMMYNMLKSHPSQMILYKTHKFKTIYTYLNRRQMLQLIKIKKLDNIKEVYKI
ncbi:cation channel family protein [Stylonychia lemnae]|uniref:Cation channel family protein n=1 Tax=Stylonychia lemnae TaxID=5949 RepID=A0A078AH78_STYLE|nr:cation channel family protein [Stylonychia lemnae]|eukprot:CDW81599.1 cation channel family protein [Stylonychia lemnae]